VRLAPFYGTRIGAHTEYPRRTFLDIFQEGTVRNSGGCMTPSVSITLEAAHLARASSAEVDNLVDRRVMWSVAYAGGPIRH